MSRQIMTLDDATYQQHTNAIQARLVDVLDKYGLDNPSIPLTCVLDALSETLVNISVNQLGATKTIQYLQDILTTVKEQSNN